MWFVWSWYFDDLDHIVISTTKAYVGYECVKLGFALDIYFSSTPNIDLVRPFPDPHTILIDQETGIFSVTLQLV